MEIGKLPNDLLEKIIISNIKNKRDEVLIGSGVGKDSAVIDFGEEVCVMSTDPITGATEGLGQLAVHISCNDVAASGAEPVGVLITILAPPKTTKEEIEEIMRDAGKAAKEINIEIMGGHTEITDSVNRMVLSTTVIGKQEKARLPNPENIKVGDQVLITKYAGIEGTSIIAKELENTLINKIDKEKIKLAQNMDSLLSVVKEGRVCGEIGVDYMHDITEGGLYGAIWEATKAINKGIKIKLGDVPVKDITRKITDLLDIDVYKLISSGSMLVISKEENVSKIEKELELLDIKVTVIGEVIEEEAILDLNGETSIIEQPGSDELYRAISFEK